MRLFKLFFQFRKINNINLKFNAKMNNYLKLNIGLKLIKKNGILKEIFPIFNFNYLLNK